MARAKLDAPPATRKVHVHEERRYTKEEPEIVDGEYLEPEGDEVQVSPLETFLRGLDDDRQLTLNVYILPNYHKDGRYGSRATRTFVTNFPFSSEDVDNYQSRVQAASPAGGQFYFDLRDRGLVLRQWSEAIGPAPGYQPPAAPAPGYQPPVINVNQTEPQKAFDGVAIIREQMSLAKDLIGMAKDLSPSPAVVTTSNGEPAAVPLKEKLLETVLVKMVESQKPESLDRISELLGGGKESGWVESIITTIGPSLGTFLTQIGPGLGSYLTRLATGGGPHSSIGVPMNPAGVPAQLPDGSTPPAPPAVSPSERAWRRVLGRLVDDLFEHVNLVESGQLGIDVHSASESVIDLAGRFSENPEINQTIAQLMVVTPEQLLDMCGMMIPNPNVKQRLVELKMSAAAREWLEELQTETRLTLNEPPPPAAGDEADAEITEEKEN